MTRIKLFFEHYTNSLTVFVFLRKCGVCKSKARMIAGLYERIVN